jgi:hypothetical protein
VATAAGADAAPAARPILDALTGAPAPVLREAFMLVFAAAAVSALGALVLATTLPARRLARASGDAPASES